MLMMCIFISLCICSQWVYRAIRHILPQSENGRTSCWIWTELPLSTRLLGDIIITITTTTIRVCIKTSNLAWCSPRSKMRKDKHLDSCEVKTINEGLIIVHSQDAWKCIFENQRKSPWRHDLTSPPRAHINQFNSWSQGLTTLCLVVTFQ